MSKGTETDFNGWDDNDPHASELIVPRASKKPKTKRFGVSWTEDEVFAIEALQKHLMTFGYMPPRGRSETVAAAVKAVAHALHTVKMQEDGTCEFTTENAQRTIDVFESMFDGLHSSNKLNCN